MQTKPILDISPLESYRAFCAALPMLTETHMARLLKYEARHEKRLSILERLHQKYSAVRAAREREELLNDD